MDAIKRFTEWIGLKERLHEKTYKPPLFKEGEVWWCSLGENIGREINGKSQVFTRPVVVFKKLSSNIFLGLPTSTQEKIGTWYVPITLGGKTTTVVLSQARSLDYKRFFSKLGQLDDTEMQKVRTAFKNLYCP